MSYSTENISESAAPPAGSAVADAAPIRDEALGKPFPEVQLEPPRYQERPGRMVLLHGFLLIPHYFALLFLVVGQYFGLTAAFVVVTFTRRWPRGIFDFVAAVQAWQNRVNAYSWGITREYPPFELRPIGYPVASHFTYPENGIARWRPWVQSTLILPRRMFVGIAIGLRAMCRYYLAMWSVLLFGRYPRASYRSAVRTILWQERNFAYMNFMIDRYPPTFAQTPAP